MDLPTLQSLTTPTGRALIDQARDLRAAGTPDLGVLSTLRRSVSADLAAAALAQVGLRERAVRKLGPEAVDWLLLPESLEQLTRAEVAAARAAFLAEHGGRSVIDAGAGLGGDTIALARAGIDVLAIEQDPLVAAALRANVDHLGVADRVTVRVADAVDALAAAPPDAVLFADPARRSGGRRVFDPEQCAPPLSWLVAAYDAGRQVVAKMSPSLSGTQVPDDWGCAWTSTQTEQGRSVVEAMLLSPPLAAPPRRAWVLGSPGYRLSGEPDADLPVGPLGRYLYEPDGAVNQAELVGELLCATDGHLLHPRIGYFTADAAHPGLPARCFEVLDAMPWSKRRVAAALAAYDASDLVVKMRGLVLDPVPLRAAWLRALRGRTAAPLTVVLIGPKERPTAAIARPVDPAR